LILMLIAATVQSTRQMKIVVLLMCVATLVLNRGFWDTVSSRDFSRFSYDLRDEGGMGYAGVNGFAAFEAQFVVFLLAMVAFKNRLLVKLGYVALALFSSICLMYSFSRGGYVALVVGCLFLGLVKQRKLLVFLAVLACTWTSVTPPAVQQRVLMTYDEKSGELDHSAELRLDLWNEAVGAIRSNPIIGVGFDTYAYTKHVHDYKDSHNYYLKALAETGFVGLVLVGWILGKMFRRGFKLSRIAKDPFLASLGLGLAAWVVCSFIANCFGDRWTFLQVNGYMWVLGGLVARGLMLEQATEASTTDDPDPAPKALAPEATAVL
jgi:putative inorganic carbon (hco3(-)) transporter